MNNDTTWGGKRLAHIRKRSLRITLVLIGAAGLTALSGCGRREADKMQNIYANREDCLADWGNKPEDCQLAANEHHRRMGYYYGPSYSSGSTYTRGGYSSSRPGSRSIGSTPTGSPSRGGFGSTGRASSSSS